MFPITPRFSSNRVTGRGLGVLKNTGGDSSLSYSPEEKTRLIVFAKLPEPGKVKTRLAAAVGVRKAAALYRAWVPRFVKTLMSLEASVSVQIRLAPESETENREEMLRQAELWIPFDVDWGFQEGEDLGRRLKDGFDEQFRSGWRRIIALGSDSPQLSCDQLFEVIHLLDDHEAALGPCEDGGYYAIGLKHPPGDLFEAVRWSTNQAFADTRERMEKRGWKVGIGPISFDVDTFSDLNRLVSTGGSQWAFLKEILDKD